MANRLETPTVAPSETALRSTSACCVERACAAFHAAHDAIVTLTKGRDHEFEVDGLAELSEQRDTAFQKVRSFPARTNSAYQAKLRVLSAMRTWFSVEDPNVSGFAIQLAAEAASLIDTDRQQNRTCEPLVDVREQDSRLAGRRRPFSWLTRPRRNSADTPVAS